MEMKIGNGFACYALFEMESTAGGINTQGGANIHDLDTNSINSLPPDTKIIEQTTGNEVLIMNANDDDRTASFFAQPGILAGKY